MAPQSIRPQIGIGPRHRLDPAPTGHTSDADDHRKGLESHQVGIYLKSFPFRTVGGRRGMSAGQGCIHYDEAVQDLDGGSRLTGFRTL